MAGIDGLENWESWLVDEHLPKDDRRRFMAARNLEEASSVEAWLVPERLQVSLGCSEYTKATRIHSVRRLGTGVAIKDYTEA